LKHCFDCARLESGKRLKEAGNLGRFSGTVTGSAKKKQYLDTIAAAVDGDLRYGHTSGLAQDEFYVTKIQPRLHGISKLTIASLLDVSKDYAYEMASGDKIPHRRHWMKLAELVDVSPG
jgi:hypothetical protein